MPHARKSSALRYPLFLLSLLLFPACMGTPTQYRQVDITTPAGNTTAMVGVYSPPATGPDGKPLTRDAERPFHMVPHDVTTPGGTRTVYVREYE